MSERTFRIVQGAYLLIALFLEIEMMIYIFLGVFLFEAISNWRIPILISRLRYGQEVVDGQGENVTRSKVESERMFRITIDLFLFSYVIYPEALWFMPWFLAVMLLLAGITKICPIILFFRYLGFR